MNKASFWVGVAQLVVAILALAVSVVALHKQAPACPPPSTHHYSAHHHRTPLQDASGKRQQAPD